MAMICIKQDHRDKVKYFSLVKEGKASYGYRVDRLGSLFVTLENGTDYGLTVEEDLSISVDKEPFHMSIIAICMPLEFIQNE